MTGIKRLLLLLTWFFSSGRRIRETRVLSCLLFAVTAGHIQAAIVCSTPCPGSTVTTSHPPPTSTGADGPLFVTTNLTLSLVPDTIFNFTTLNTATGSLLDFGAPGAATTIYLLATSDIQINGSINAGPASLVISTPGSITLNGSLPGSNLTLWANSVILGQSTSFGGLALQSAVTLTGGTSPITVNQNPDQSVSIINNNFAITNPGGIITIAPTPLPTTALLFIAGLGVIGLFYRRRITVATAHATQISLPASYC